MSLTPNDQKFWMRVKELAKNNLGQAPYDFFIEPAKLLEITDNNAKIYLESNMHQDFWRKQEDLIKTAGFEIFSKEINFSLYSADEINIADYENEKSRRYNRNRYDSTCYGLRTQKWLES